MKPYLLRVGNLPKFITSLVDLSTLPKDDKPQVALVGRSNVGKSSLINHLAGQKDLARVSSEAGRTRTINLYEIEPKYILVDMPGYGFAKTSQEKQSEFGNLIADYVETTPQLALILLVIDAYVGPTDLDQDMLEILRTAGVPFTMIINKVDKLSQSEMAKLKKTLALEYEHIPHVLHSMYEGKDRDRVLGVIHEALH